MENKAYCSATRSQFLTMAQTPNFRSTGDPASGTQLPHRVLASAMALGSGRILPEIQASSSEGSVHQLEF